MSESHAESAQSLRSFMLRHPDLHALYFRGTNVALQGLVVRFWRDPDGDYSSGDMKLLRPLIDQMVTDLVADAELPAPRLVPPWGGGVVQLPGWSSGSIPTGGPIYRT